jgi:membrane protein
MHPPYPENQNIFSLIFWLFKEAYREFDEDHASRLSAAISYYTVFSIAPLLIIAIGVAGLVFDRSVATQQMVGQIRGLVGDKGAQIILTMLENFNQAGSGLIATLIGMVTLLLGASGAFAQLQNALNTIWEVRRRKGSGIWGLLRARLLSFSLVLVIGFMLLVSLVVSAGLAAMGKYLQDHLPMSSAVIQLLNFGISMAVTTLLFGLIFKMLPDAYIRWRDVWVGAGVTSLLFSLGRFAIGLYLGRSSVSSAYGAAGSLIILLIWINYSTQILLFGAEFTQVYTNRFGAAIRPKPNAEALVTVVEAPN